MSRFLFIYLLASVAAVHAAIYTATVNGSSGTVGIFTVDTAAHTLTVTGTFNDFNSSRWIEGLSTDPTPSTIGISWATGTSNPQTIALSPGVDTVFVATSRFGAQTSTIGRAGPPPATYTLDVPLPKNGTAWPVTYKFYQGTTEINSVTMAPGDGPSTVHLTGLATQDPVWVAEYTGHLEKDPSTGVITFVANTQYQIVAHGIPDLPGSTPTTDTPTPPYNPPAIPSPSAPPTTPTPPATPPAPSPSTPVTSHPASPTAPTPTANPNPYTPTGTGGATSTDIQDAVNKIVADNNSTRTNDTSNTNKIIGAIDNAATSSKDNATKLLGSVDNLNATNKASADALKTSVNQQTSLLGQIAQTQTAQLNSLNATNATGFDGLHQSLAALGDLTKTSNDILTDIRTDTNKLAQPDTDAINDFVTTVTANATAKANDNETLWNARTIPNVTVASDTTSPGSFFNVTILGRNVDLNPVNRWPWLFAWVKFILAWIIAAIFVAWIWSYYPQIQHDILTAGPAKPNPGAITGMVPIIGGAIAVGITTLIVTSCLAAPVALFAVADSGPYGAFLSSMGTDPRDALAAPSGVREAILYLFDQCFPLHTGLTALIEYFVIKKAGTIIATGVQMLIRALPI